MLKNLGNNRRDLVPFLLPHDPPHSPHGRNWPKLFLKSREEEVFPLFFRALRKMGEMTPEREQLYYAYAARTLLQWESFKKIVGAFKEASVAAVPFKGFDLSLRVYGDLFARVLADLDFLIHSQDLPKASFVLEKLGFFPFETDPYSFQKGRGTVELHPTILHVKRFENWDRSPLTIEGFWDRSQTFDCEGVSMTVLAPEDLFLALVIHFVFHHHLRGLKWMIDLVWVMETLKPNWALICERAEENYLTPLLQAALYKLKVLGVRHQWCLTPEVKAPSFFFLSLANTRLTRFFFRLRFLPTWNMRRRMCRFPRFS